MLSPIPTLDTSIINEQTDVPTEEEEKVEEEVKEEKTDKGEIVRIKYQKEPLDDIKRKAKSFEESEMEKLKKKELEDKVKKRIRTKKY